MIEPINQPVRNRENAQRALMRLRDVFAGPNADTADGFFEIIDLRDVGKETLTDDIKAWGMATFDKSWATWGS